MTPELLWKLGRVSGLGISKDGKYVVYSVSTPDWEANKSKRSSFIIPVTGGDAKEITNPDSLLNDKNTSPDGKYIVSNKEVQVKKIKGSDIYPELSKSNAYVFDNLNDRHWDTWEEGKFDHVFIANLDNGKPVNEKDIMPDEPYDCPQKPFGGDEDYIWNPNSKQIVYVTKKKYGTEYAISTNTDLYSYNIETGKTENLTPDMKGYDLAPSYNKNGILAWMSMKRDGYEADKQDIVAFAGSGVVNLTKYRDDINVEGFRWAEDGKHIFFWAPINGTMQLFEVEYTGTISKNPAIRQITKGDFDVNAIIGQSGNMLIVSRNDMNHAPELYSVNISNGSMSQLTHVNDATYNSIGMCRTERRFVKTTDAGLGYLPTRF
jgi:Tol biopolymer transport system component